MNSRPSRSGSRRRSGGDRSRGQSSRRRSSDDNFHVEREPRKPPGLLGKIKAFFGLGTQPVKPLPHGRDQRDQRQQRPEGNEPSREPRQRTPREPREPRQPRESRKPEVVEVTTSRLYIGNLSYDAAETDLSELFSGVGTVANVEIITNKHTQRSKGFAFIQMNSISEAQRAVDELHDKEYMSRKLVVSGAKLPPDRSIGRERAESASVEETPAPEEATPAAQA